MKLLQNAVTPALHAFLNQRFDKSELRSAEDGGPSLDPMGLMTGIPELDMHTKVDQARHDKQILQSGAVRLLPRPARRPVTAHPFHSIPAAAVSRSRRKELSQNPAVWLPLPATREH